MSAPPSPRSTLPPLLAEQLVLDELPAARLAALRDELGQARLDAAVAELRADDRALAARFTPEQLPTVDALQRLAELERGRRAAQRVARFDLVLQRLVLAGVALLALSTPLWWNQGDAGETGAAPKVAPSPGFATGEGDTRIKGDARILAFRKRGAVVEPLSSGARARAGDLLQLGYDAAGQSHGVLLSIDGRGVVTQHLPGAASRSTALESGGQQLLPSAYALDDAPGFERFVLVTSQQSLDVDALRIAAERVAALPSQRARSTPLSLPAGARQVSLLLVKEAP